MIRRFSVVMLASITLHGCMFSPGQHMDTSQLVRDGSPESSRVELIPITPKLIAMDAASQVRESVPSELLSYTPGGYRVGANDLLFITVWDHPELTAPSGPQQQIDATVVWLVRTVRCFTPISVMSRPPVKPSKSYGPLSPNACRSLSKALRLTSAYCVSPARPW